MSENKTTILENDSIRLSTLTADDIKLKVAWYNDPEINRHLVLYEPLELEKSLRWLESLQGREDRLDLVIETNEGRAIGVIGLLEIDKNNKTAEIYIVIGERDYWGKGVMLEAESLLIRHAFDKMGLEKIWAQARCENMASIITMKKLGFKIEGQLRQHKVMGGERVDLVMLGLLKDEFVFFDG